jgi:hypothetical protein
MRISILDPQLRMLSGHFLDLDLRLAAHWATQGHTVTIHCGKDAPAALDPLFFGIKTTLRRTFTGLSREWIRPGVDNVEELRRAAATYHQDLMALEAADLMVWPSGSGVCAMAHALSGVAAPAVFGIFEHPGTNSAASPGAYAAAREYMRLRRQRMAWGVYVEDFNAAWSSILGSGNLYLLPYPTAGRPRPRKPSQPLCIGFVGALRPERCIDISVPLIKQLLDRGFAVKLQDGRGDVPAFSHDRLERFGFLPDITPVIAACDLIVWPAQAINYVGRPSGIVAESIACGVPLVMSSACYPSEMAVKHGAAVFFQRPALNEVLEAVDLAATQIEPLRKKAHSSARRWSRKNGLERLADRILDLAGVA